MRNNILKDVNSFLFPSSITVKELHAKLERLIIYMKETEEKSLPAVHANDKSEIIQKKHSLLKELSQRHLFHQKNEEIKFLNAVCIMGILTTFTSNDLSYYDSVKLRQICIFIREALNATLHTFIKKRRPLAFKKHIKSILKFVANIPLHHLIAKCTNRMKEAVNWFHWFYEVLMNLEMFSDEAVRDQISRTTRDSAIQILQWTANQEKVEISHSPLRPVFVMLLSNLVDLSEHPYIAPLLQNILTSTSYELLVNTILTESYQYSYSLSSREQHKLALLQVDALQLLDILFKLFSFKPGCVDTALSIVASDLETADASRRERVTDLIGRLLSNDIAGNTLIDEPRYSVVIEKFINRFDDSEPPIRMSAVKYGLLTMMVHNNCLLSDRLLKVLTDRSTDTEMDVRRKLLQELRRWLVVEDGAYNLSVCTVEDMLKLSNVWRLLRVCGPKVIDRSSQVAEDAILLYSDIWQTVSTKTWRLKGSDDEGGEYRVMSDAERDVFSGISYIPQLLTNTFIKGTPSPPYRAVLVRCWRHLLMVSVDGAASNRIHQLMSLMFCLKSFGNQDSPFLDTYLNQYIVHCKQTIKNFCTYCESIQTAADTNTPSSNTIDTLLIELLNVHPITLFETKEKKHEITQKNLNELPHKIQVVANKLKMRLKDIKQTPINPQLLDDLKLLVTGEKPPSHYSTPTEFNKGLTKCGFEEFAPIVENAFPILTSDDVHIFTKMHRSCLTASNATEMKLIMSNVGCTLLQYLYAFTSSSSTLLAELTEVLKECMRLFNLNEEGSCGVPQIELAYETLNSCLLCLNAAFIHHTISDCNMTSHHTYQLCNVLEEICKNKFCNTWYKQAVELLKRMNAVDNCKHLAEWCCWEILKKRMNDGDVSNEYRLAYSMLTTYEYDTSLWETDNLQLLEAINEALQKRYLEDELYDDIKQTEDVVGDEENASNVDTSNVDTSNVDTSNVDTSNVDTSNVDTSNVDTSNVDTLDECMDGIKTDVTNDRVLEFEGYGDAYKLKYIMKETTQYDEIECDTSCMHSMKSELEYTTKKCMSDVENMYVVNNSTEYTSTSVRVLEEFELEKEVEVSIEYFTSEDKLTCHAMNEGEVEEEGDVCTVKSESGCSTQSVEVSCRSSVSPPLEEKPSLMLHMLAAYALEAAEFGLNGVKSIAEKKYKRQLFIKFVVRYYRFNSSRILELDPLDTVEMLVDQLSRLLEIAEEVEDDRDKVIDEIDVHQNEGIVMNINTLQQIRILRQHDLGTLEDKVFLTEREAFKASIIGGIFHLIKHSTLNKILSYPVHLKIVSLIYSCSSHLLLSLITKLQSLVQMIVKNAPLDNQWKHRSPAVQYIEELLPPLLCAAGSARLAQTELFAKRTLQTMLSYLMRYREGGLVLVQVGVVHQLYELKKLSSRRVYQTFLFLLEELHSVSEESVKQMYGLYDLLLRKALVDDRIWLEYVCSIGKEVTEQYLNRDEEGDELNINEYFIPPHTFVLRRSNKGLLDVDKEGVDFDVMRSKKRKVEGIVCSVKAAKTHQDVDNGGVTKGDEDNGIEEEKRFKSPAAVVGDEKLRSMNLLFNKWMAPPELLQYSIRCSQRQRRSTPHRTSE